MEYLSRRQVILAVEEYLTKAPYDYALMINGEWGSGKSHLVKHDLIKHIEQIDVIEDAEGSDRGRNQKYQAINISLYGISDLNNLSNQIATSIMYRKRFWDTKAGGVAKKIVPIVGAGLRLLTDLRGTSISTDKDGFAELFSGIAQDFSHLNDYVFIFDDLERSSIPVGEVFGFLSNLVELNSVKTIIVANEKEIKDILTNEGLHQKILQIASISDKINLPEVESDENTINKVIRAMSPNSNAKENKELNIEDLKVIAEKLFPSDENYKRFKEKVVGQTITYRPDMNEVVNPLMIKTFDKIGYSFQDSSFVVNSLPSSIVEVFQLNECYNLRTAQILLNYLGHFLPKMILAIKNKFGNEDVFSLNQIVRSIGRVAIEHSKGTSYNDIDSIVGGLDLTLSNKVNLSYKFAADYFYFGIMDMEYLNEVINVMANYFWQANGDPNSPLNKLSSFYTLTDIEAMEYCNELHTEFQKGKYRFDQYPTIIRNLIDLYDVGLIMQGEIEDMVEQMCENVNGKMMPSYVYEFTVVPQAYYHADYYKDLLKKITEASKQSKNETLSLMIQSALKQRKLYSQELKEYYSSRQVCNDQNSYFLIADQDELLAILKGAKSGEILELRHFVSWIYHDIRTSEFEKSRDSILQFKDVLETALAEQPGEFFDRIAFKQASWLKGDLNRILEKVSKD